MLGGEADEVEQLSDTRLDPGRLPAFEPGHHTNVGGNGHVRKKADVLDDIADRPAQRDRIPLGGVPATDQYSPLLRQRQPVDQPQHRGLARAAAPDEGDDLATPDVERQRLEHGHARRLDVGDAVELDRGGGHRRSHCNERYCGPVKVRWQDPRICGGQALAATRALSCVAHSGVLER